MDDTLIEQAKENVGDERVFINAACRRASELARGAKPTISVLPNDQRSYLEIAIQEIAEENISVEMSVEE